MEERSGSGRVGGAWYTEERGLIAGRGQLGETREIK